MLQVKRTFAIRLRYLLMNAVALRPAFTFHFFLRYYNADNLRFTTAPLMNCIYGIR